MNRKILIRIPRLLAARLAMLALSAAPWIARADLVEFVNGDQYNGTVVSMTETELVFRGEVQGKVTLPRAKVARITFRQAFTTADQPLVLPQPDLGALNTPKPNTRTAQPTAAASQPRLQGFNTNLIAQVKQQFLAQAPPEAGKKFDDLLGGFLAGSISVADIRAQAKDSIKQIQQLKKESPEMGDALDSYLEILQNFVQEAEPAAAKTNAPGSP